MSAVTPEASNGLRSRIVAVLREDRDVRNIGALADQLETAIRSAEPVAWLRHGEEAPVQNVPFGAMWISDKDDPRSFPVYDCPQQPAPSVAVKALEWSPWPGNDQTKNGQSGRRIMRRADGAGVTYSLERVEPQSEWFYIPPGQVAGDWYVMEFWNEVAGPFKTDLEALEWCRQDHETRIRSAFSAQVQDVAMEDVLLEVKRQVEVEGWSSDHDDAHDKGEMAGAAACYALEGVAYTAPDHYPPRKKYAAVVDARNSIPEKERETTREAIKLALGEPAAPRNWPWHASWWKPTTTRRNLVKAAALLISEIKRLDRAAAPANQEGGI